MRVRLLVAIAIAVVTATPASAGERGLLWRVVQACLADHSLTGGPFPCLAVDTREGVERGYAVLRAPFERLHIIVTPTTRTVGIEAPRLLEPGAPNYFADAWASRHFVSDDLTKKPGRDDFALALNSRRGRSQDQLHIHVACVRADVKRFVTSVLPKLRPGRWVPVKVLPRAPLYQAMPISAEDLSGANPIALVASGLEPDDMAEMTIVVVGIAGADGKPGFVLLARHRLIDRRDDAHGEVLLDGSCRAFR